MRRRLLIAGVAAAMAACSLGPTMTDVTGPSLPALTPPTAPQTVYTGTITDSIGGTGTVTVSLGTSGSLAGGTWSTTFPGQKSSTWFISGTLNGTSYTATVSCSSVDLTTVCVPDCRKTLTATVTSSALSGTYAEVPGDTCTGHSGSVSANRQ